MKTEIITIVLLMVLYCSLIVQGETTRNEVIGNTFSTIGDNDVANLEGSTHAGGTISLNQIILL